MPLTASAMMLPSLAEAETEFFFLRNISFSVLCGRNSSRIFDQL